MTPAAAATTGSTTSLARSATASRSAPWGFHPAFEDSVVDEYLGLGAAAGAGHGGNRAAYLAMLAATPKSADHATITGHAPKGRKLQLQKSFQTPTSPIIDQDGNPGPGIEVPETLKSSYRTPGGKFSFMVNPTTGPKLPASTDACPPHRVSRRSRWSIPRGIPA